MRRFKAKIGQPVFLPAKVTKGMFPSERYFYIETEPGNAIAGYVTDDQVVGHSVRAVVIDIVEDGAILALPGEVSRNNLVRVPLSLLKKYASA